MSNPLIDAAKAQTNSLKLNEAVCVDSTGILEARKVIFIGTSQRQSLDDEDAYKNIFSIFEQQVKEESDRPKTLAIYITDIGDADAFEEVFHYLKDHPNRTIRIIYHSQDDFENDIIYAVGKQLHSQSENIKKRIILDTSVPLRFRPSVYHNVDAIVCPISENYDLEKSGPTAKEIVKVAEKNLQMKTKREESDRKQQEDLALHSHARHLKPLSRWDDYFRSWNDYSIQTENWVTLGNISSESLEELSEPLPPEAERVIEIFNDIRELEFPSEEAREAAAEEWIKEIHQIFPNYVQFVKLVPSKEGQINFFKTIVQKFGRILQGSLSEKFDQAIRKIFGPMLEAKDTRYFRLLELKNALAKATTSQEAHEILLEIRMTASKRMILNDLHLHWTAMNVNEFLDELELNYNNLKNKQIIHGVITDDVIPKSPAERAAAKKKLTSIIARLPKKKEQLIDEFIKLCPTRRSFDSLFTKDEQQQKAEFVKQCYAVADKHELLKLKSHLNSLKKENAKLFRSTDFETHLKKLKIPDPYEAALEDLERQKFKEGRKPPKKIQDYDDDLL